MPRFSASTGPCRSHHLAVDTNFAAGGRQIARQQLHQRRFARAVFADHGVNFAGIDGKRDITQHFDDTERFGKADRLHHRPGAGGWIVRVNAHLAEPRTSPAQY